VIALFACGPAEVAEPAFVEVRVVRGDTLGRIAAAHGVTVAQLRAWNGLQGDLIEVGQVLRLQPGSTPPPRRRTAPASAPGDAGQDALAMPSPRPCLPPPTGDDLGDEGATASRGLDAEAADRVLDAFVAHTTRCAPPDTDPPAGPLTVELTVGCDGIVRSAVAVAGGWPDDVAACVADVLRHAPMPVHDLPDGDTLRYPLRWAR
jgi:murein DD-endopeptidase MepM/ murein hydrolase activator NlpD